MPVKSTMEISQNFVAFSEYMNFKDICVPFSSVSKEGSVGPRTGFFHHFAQREIIAKRFDPKEEIFVSDVSNEDIERFRLDLQNLDKNLGKY